MAETLKVLGQVIPAANTDSNLITVAAATSDVISAIYVCNQASADATFRVAVRPAGATIATVHYLAYDAKVLANDSLSVCQGVTLATTDIVTVRSNSGTVSFSAFGTEVT